MKFTAIAVMLLAAGGFAALPGQDDVKVPDHQILAADEIKWVEGPPSMPAGAKVAVLEGNPAKPGPFTMRIKLPAGYKVGPHYHPAVEHVTVLSGTLHFGAGDSFDETKTKPLGPGGFAVMQTGVKHFVFTKDEVVLQNHAVGPWGITYVNPSDDPRSKK